jgi:4-oxalocrotonate tautomerase
MPFVGIKLLEGALPDAQRAEMIQRVTDAVVSVYGEGLRPVTWVVIEDVRSGEWGIGGKLLTVADVRALMGAPAAAGA